MEEGRILGQALGFGKLLRFQEIPLRRPLVHHLPAKGKTRMQASLRLCLLRYDQNLKQNQHKLR